MMTSYQVSVSAEAYATALFAQSGYDVSVQYGANQPEYDIIISKGKKNLRVSVKGTQEDGWLLAAKHSHLSYHESIDLWKKEKHRGKKIIYCLVQFQNVGIGNLPRIYLVTVPELAKQLKNQRGKTGYGVLKEDHTWERGKFEGVNDKVPITWKFSVKRVKQLFNSVA